MDDDAWEKPVSVPDPGWRWRTRLWLAATIVAALAAITLGVLGVVRTTSLDVPLPHRIRLGFFGNGGFTRWTCSDGHDHWSFPYWSGAVVCAVATALFARRFQRSRR